MLLGNKVFGITCFYTFNVKIIYKTNSTEVKILCITCCLQCYIEKQMRSVGYWLLNLVGYLSYCFNIIKLLIFQYV